jgi:hypothetical protein
MHRITHALPKANLLKSVQEEAHVKRPSVRRVFGGIQRENEQVEPAAEKVGSGQV